MKRQEEGKNTKIIYNILFYGVMILYFLILFALLFHKKSIGSFRSINLIPFRTISSYLFSDYLLQRSFALSNLVGNIVIFIPMGIYFPLLIRKKSVFMNTLSILFISTLVEAFQYMFAVGATDIDDVILNTLGGLIGVIFFRILDFIFKDQTKNRITILAPIGGIAALLILLLYSM